MNNNVALLFISVVWPNICAGLLNFYLINNNILIIMGEFVACWLHSFTLISIHTRLKIPRSAKKRLWRHIEQNQSVGPGPVLCGMSQVRVPLYPILLSNFGRFFHYASVIKYTTFGEFENLFRYQASTQLFHKVRFQKNFYHNHFYLVLHELHITHLILSVSYPHKPMETV